MVSQRTEVLTAQMTLVVQEVPTMKQERSWYRW